MHFAYHLSFRYPRPGTHALVRSHALSLSPFSSPSSKLHERDDGKESAGSFHAAGRLFMRGRQSQLFLVLQPARGSTSNCLGESSVMELTNAYSSFPSPQ